MQLGHIELDEKARSQTNSLILGSIGFGKSKFLEYLMRQDLRQRQPYLHGSLFEKVKAWCAFNAYFDRRVNLLDPSSGSFIKGFNPFRKKEGLEVSAQTSGMVEAVMSVWGDSNPKAYPVMFKLLKGIFTVMVEKDIALYEAFQLLSNRQALHALVSQLPDPLVKSLWSDLSRLSRSEWSRSAAPTINRLFRIVQSKAIQRYMCAPRGSHNLACCNFACNTSTYSNKRSSF